MTKPRLAVLAFPGTNCETETARGAARNGFDAEIVRWNELDRIGDFDAYVMAGGFSFEDRGRSGALAAREPIFALLRDEAAKGKLILGVCNGAQMIVESGLIPVEDIALAYSLAPNIRRNAEGRVMGTGYYNTWVHMVPERKDTAFTNSVEGILHVPIAHGEGRFVTRNDKAREALSSGSHVGFRYCDEHGNVSSAYPITPNGAAEATAAIVNKEGTIMGSMPHPERFFSDFCGDQVFQSMRKWLEEGRSPSEVAIGDLGSQPKPELTPFTPAEDAILIETELIITDNEAFSVSQTASFIADEDVQLRRTQIFEIRGAGVTEEKLIETGLLFNPNKERIAKDLPAARYGVLPYESDSADLLAQKLSTELGTPCQVRVLTGWNFVSGSQAAQDKILTNRLFNNPHAAQIFTL